MLPLINRLARHADELTILGGREPQSPPLGTHRTGGESIRRSLGFMRRGSIAALAQFFRKLGKPALDCFELSFELHDLAAMGGVCAFDGRRLSADFFSRQTSNFILQNDGKIHRTLDCSDAPPRPSTSVTARASVRHSPR